LVLEAKRFSGKDALEYRVVDRLGGIEEIMGLITKRKLVEKGKSGVYGTMKAEMFRESISYLEGHEREEKRDEENRLANNRRREERQNRVKG
jgi:Delta3-Delta2-enoyl-CoA isomerase